MAKIQVYSSKGQKTGTIDMPKEFAAKENVGLMTQAVHVYEDRSHQGTAKVQTRAEVNATTAKMYRQKGTGNARHGSRKAPIFKGGGVAHGPKGIKRILTLSKGLKNSALKIALSAKVEEGKLVIAEKLDSIGKTKDASAMIKEIIKDLGLGKSLNIRVVLEKSKKDLVRFFRNIRNLDVTFWRNLNAGNIYSDSLVILDKDALQESRNPKKETILKTTSKLANETKMPGKKVTKTVKPSFKKTKSAPKTKAKTSEKKVKKGNKK